MRDGAYGKKNKGVTWLFQKKSPFFSPSYVRRENVDKFKGGCGTAVVSMITGINPKEVDKYFKTLKTDWWKDLHIKKFLKKRGYQITELTKANVTDDVNGKWVDPITRLHVLLVGQQVFYGEGTWALIFNGFRYHNFEEECLNPIEFINNPTDTVYVIEHKDWK